MFAGAKASPDKITGTSEQVRDFHKIAVGGMVGKSAKFKQRFISEVFARVWPCKIHGFGISSRPLVMGFPFHSVDASSWEIAPTAFGTWAGFNGARLSVRGSKQNLVSEVRHYLALERDARARWASGWSKFQETDRPSVRLAINRPHSWEHMGAV